MEKSEAPHTLCEACVIGKHHRTSSQVINRMDLYKQATKKKELSHGDLVGSDKITHNLEGSRIEFGLMNDLTDLTEIYLLKKKSEAFSRLKKYAAKRKAEGNPMRRFWGDNEGEFDSAACKEWMEIEGIQWEPTTLYNLYQNKMAERCFRTPSEKIRAMLYDVRLPPNQWGEAISTAVYLKNKNPTKLLKRIMPYETDNGRKPDLSNLHRFGYIAYNHDENPKKKKLSNQGIKCQFLGYEGRNQYRL